MKIKVQTNKPQLKKSPFGEFRGLEIIVQTAREKT